MKSETRRWLLWFILIALLLLFQLLGTKNDWFLAYPKGWEVPFSTVLNHAMNWVVEWFGWFFRGLADIFAIPVSWVQQFLQWLPWPVVIAVTAAISWAASGWRLALVFDFGSLLYGRCRVLDREHEFAISSDHFRSPCHNCGICIRGLGI